MPDLMPIQPAPLNLNLQQYVSMLDLDLKMDFNKKENQKKADELLKQFNQASYEIAVQAAQAQERAVLADQKRRQEEQFVKDTIAQSARLVKASAELKVIMDTINEPYGVETTFNSPAAIELKVSPMIVDIQKRIEVLEARREIHLNHISETEAELKKELHFDLDTVGFVSNLVNVAGLSVDQISAPQVAVALAMKESLIANQQAPKPTPENTSAKKDEAEDDWEFVDARPLEERKREEEANNLLRSIARIVNGNAVLPNANMFNNIGALSAHAVAAHHIDRNIAQEKADLLNMQRKLGQHIVAPTAAKGAQSRS